MDFSQPINGWEFVLSTLIGIITTVLSVWIGVSVALAQERRAMKRERDKEDSELARTIVRDAQSQAIESVTGAFMHMWFRDPNEKAGALAARWEPGPFEGRAERFLSGLPESEQAVFEWTKLQLDEYITTGNRDFPNADNEVIRYVTTQYEKRIKDALALYAAGRISADWFSRRLA